MDMQKFLKIALVLILITSMGIKGTLMFQNEEFEDSRSYHHFGNIQNWNERNSGDVQESYYENNINYIGLKAYYIGYGLIYSVIPSVGLIKILEVLQFGLLLVLIYYLTKEATASRESGILAISIFLAAPVLFYSNQSAIRPEIFLMNLFLLTSLLLLKSSILFQKEAVDTYLNKVIKKINLGKAKKHFKNNYIFALTILVLILALFPAESLLFNLTILIYLMLISLFNIAAQQYYREFSAFTTLLISGAFILFYKEILLEQGIQTLSLNVPQQLSILRGLQFSIINLFVLIGGLAILGGIYATYFYLNNRKLKESRKALFYVSGILAASFAYFLKIGSSTMVLTYLAAFISIIFAMFINRWIKSAIDNYILNLKEGWYWLIIITLVVVGTLSLNYSFTTPEAGLEVNKEIIETMESIGQGLNTTLIIATPSVSTVIKAHNDAITLMTEDYLKITNPEKGIREIKQIYTNINSVQVQELLDQYQDKGMYENIYIYFDKNIGREFQIEEPKFKYDEDCFRVVFENEQTQVYRYMCKK